MVIVNASNNIAQKFNVTELKKHLSQAQELKKSSAKRNIKPLTDKSSTSKNLIDANEVKEKKEEFSKKGLELLKDGKVAVVTMAGGQGTRLGTNAPKGCYVIRGKSLFAMHKDRLDRLNKLTGKTVPWLLMTSEATHKPTVDYFSKEVKYADVRFFKQDSIPALDKQGEAIKADKQGTPFLAPNGNGGIFSALKSSGELEKLKKAGVKYLHVLTVDNVLNKPADPVVLGAAAINASDALSKCITRKNAEEKIGVFALEADKLVVAEYTELPKESAAFSHANIASHVFSVEFVESMSSKDELPYHLAEKKIPTEGGIMVEGYKLEKFIFDVLPHAKKPMVLEVDRTNEFSPLKNATGADSPQTCADDLEKYKPKDDLEKLIIKPQ